MTRRRALVAVALGAVIAGVVLMHARPGARCPLAASDPNALESSRRAAVLSLRGEGAAPSRRALGFAMEATAAGEVQAWAIARGGACTRELAGAALHCEHVGDEAGAIRDLYARFDPKGVLVALDLVRPSPSAGDAAARFAKIEAAIARDLGAPQQVFGEPTEDFLSRAPLRQAIARHRFADFAADVSATSFADEVVVREQYRAIPRG